MKQYLEKGSDNPLGIAFVIALIVKIVSAGLSLIPASNMVMWLLGFWLPLGGLFVYVAFGWQRTVGTMLQQSYGDSCYYLGFLFTVASIIIALIDLGLQGDAVFTVDQVAVRFAAAMVTTLIGMAIRVWLVTFGAEQKKEPEETLKGVMATASDGESFIVQANLENLELLNKSLINNLAASEQLRTNLIVLYGRVQSDLEETSKAVSQFTTEMMNASKDLFQEAQSNFREVMLQQVSNTSKCMDDMVKNSAASAQQLFDMSAKSLENASQTVADRMLSDSLPSEQWKKTLDSIGQRLNLVVNNFEKTAGTVLDATGGAGQLVQGVRDTVDKSTRKMQDEMQGIVEAFSLSTQEVSRANAEFSQNLDKNLHSLLLSISKIDTEVQTLTEQIKTFENALSKAGTRVTEKTSSGWRFWRK